MKRNLFTALALLVMMFSVFGSTVAQDDALFWDIPVLLDDDFVTGVFEDNVTARLYGFSANEGDRINISMTQITDGLDPYLVLLGDRGQVLIDDNDSGDIELASHIRDFVIPASESYFILATDFNYRDNIFVEAGQVTAPEEPLEYTLQIDGIQATDVVTLYRGTLEYGVESRGGSSPRLPVFYYGFAGTTGQSVDITMQSQEFDAALHVFAPNGDRIAINDDEIPNVSPTQPNAAIRNLELPADGLYLVFATDVFFYNAGKADQSAAFVGGRFIINLDALETVK
jgi:hypothetical protein